MNLAQPVLVLNRNWQAIDETTLETAMCDLCRAAKCAIDTSTMTALDWEHWIELPVREQDQFIRTARGHIRVPTVVVVRWAGMPTKRPKLDRSGVAARDQRICQYTGRITNDGTLDHVMPRSRGGKDTWSNLVWADRKVNEMKRDRTPEEAGLRLLRRPFEPKPLPALLTIPKRHPDWEAFLP